MTKKVRAYHHGDLKAALIQAALRLVRKKGPRGFSLNEASRTAGVSKSAPYNHFRDKNDLLVEIVILGNRTLEAELRAASTSEATDRDKLLSVYLAYIAFAQKHPDLFAVMFQSGIDKAAYPEVRNSATAAFNVALALATKIKTTQEAAKELSLGIWTMAHGFAMLMAEEAISRVTNSPVSEKTAKQLAQQFLLRN